MFRFLFFLFIVSYSLSGQSLKKVYKLYEKGEVSKFRDALDKMDEKGIQNSGKYFLFSLYHLINKENREALDSSYYFINQSKDNLKFVPQKLSQELEEINITPTSVDSVIKVIDSLEYDFVKENNSIDEYKKYMRDHEQSKFYSDALMRWHKLEFLKVSVANTWQSYKGFMDLYPNALDFLAAKSNYDKLILEDKTSDETLYSYEEFLDKNPESPYKDSIEFLILKFYGISNKIENFQSFLEKYPNSIHKKFVTQLLYHSSKRSISILDNIDVIDKDSLVSISLIDKQHLIGIYQEGSVNFIDKNGSLIVSGGNKNYSNDVLCFYDTKDFFVVTNESKTELYNRNLYKFYSDDEVRHVEDLGYGLIKIIKNSSLEIIHKSGNNILNGDYDDAYLIDGKYILIEKDDRYSLFTFLGDAVYDFIFIDVFQEGSFILFENEDNKFGVTSMIKLEESILSKNFSVNFSYDDYEYFEDGYMLIISEDKEELVDETMNYIIAPSEHIINKFNFGWTASSEFGIRVVSDDLSIPFSQLYQDIISSPKYFIGKRNDLWSVSDIKSGDEILTDLDSVYRVDDSTLWYRDGMKDALFFHNSKEISFQGNYRFKLLSPKFGGKNYIKLFSDDEDIIIDLEGDSLPSAEYYYSVEKGNTFSFLSKKFNLSQSEILKLNNKKNKKLFIGEKIKVRGYVPSDVISDSLFLIEFNGKKGIADLNGKIIIEPEFDGITNYSDNDIILIKNQKFGNFNVSSKEIIYPRFTQLLKKIGDNYLAYQEKYGIIKGDGSVIIPFEYDEILHWNDSSYLTKQDDTFYFVDNQNNQIYNFNSYNSISDDEVKVIQVNTDSGYGVYSSKHGEILKSVYDEVRRISVDDTMYFLAKREIPDANLLINLLVDYHGKIILNQALNLDNTSEVTCK